MVERAVQQVLEAEITSFLGAETYERTGERRGRRDGYKPRMLMEADQEWMGRLNQQE